jgi:hypothetical protein
MSLNVLHLNKKGEHNHQILATGIENFVELISQNYLPTTACVNTRGMVEPKFWESQAFQFQDMAVSWSINSDANKNDVWWEEWDAKAINLCYIPSSIRVLRLWSSTLRAESSKSALASNLDASCLLFWWNRTMACSKWSLMNNAASLPAQCSLTYHFWNRSAVGASFSYNNTFWCKDNHHVQNDWNSGKLNHYLMIVFLPSPGYSMDTIMSAHELLSNLSPWFPFLPFQDRYIMQIFKIHKYMLNKITYKKYMVIHKSLHNFQTRLCNNQVRHSRKGLSSTCKIGQKLWVSLPLLTCFPSVWPFWLLYHRGQKSWRDLWINLYN